MSKLVLPSVREKYEELMANKFPDDWRGSRDISEQWDYLCYIAQEAAQAVCKKDVQEGRFNAINAASPSSFVDHFKTRDSDD